jgi:dTDP-4-amino-4,6-dideoxygalactose transaminase
MLNTPFSPWPSFTKEEANTVANVVLSNKVNYWTGTECREFEKEFALWSESKYAIALANGTVALDLALKGLDIGPGDEVIVTPRTFIASISCVISAGATPIFADVDPESGNISPAGIAAAITPKTKAVICVHLAGWPCDMDAIMALSSQYRFKVIEDCAQAHGARYKGRSVGSIGHVGAWSFCQDKIMTTCGEGGMVTTNDEYLWRSMWAYKDHGKSYEAVYERQHPPGYRWLHDSFGTNWRMLEVQAAIGRIQLHRMSEWTAKRLENASRLNEALLEFTGGNGIVRLPQYQCVSCDNPVCKVSNGCNGDTPNACTHARYKFYFYLQPHNLAVGWDREKIINAINYAGVPCYGGTCSEVYLESAFEGSTLRPAERLPVAKALGETSVMLLIHPTLTGDEISKTQKIIKEVLHLAQKS